MVDFVALNSKDRKKFHAKLIEYFGLEEGFKFEGLLFVTAKNKYYLLDPKFAEYAEFSMNTKVLGMYIAEINQYGEIRLSIEGSKLLGPIAKNHVLELSSSDFDRFLHGEDLEGFETYSNQYYVICGVNSETNERDYAGCGKIKEGRLLNFMPKARRLV